MDGSSIIGQSNLSHPPVNGACATATHIKESGLQPLPARVKRIFYTNEQLQEIYPTLNKEVVRHVQVRPHPRCSK